MLIVQPKIAFTGLDVANGHSADIRFSIWDSHGDEVGTLTLEVSPQDSGTVDSMIAVAHRRMALIAKSWAKKMDELAEEYEARSR